MRRLLGLGSLLLCALFAAACGELAPGAPNGAGQGPAKPRDAAHVLNALVDLWYQERFLDEDSRVLLLRAETWAGGEGGATGPKARESLATHLEGLRPETLDAFERANATPLDLREVLHTTHEVHFVDVQVLRETLGVSRNGHEYDVALRGLLAQVPDSRQLVSLSAPGVSPDGMQALLYASERRGARVAAGYYFLLAWEDGAWRIVQKHVAWVS